MEDRRENYLSELYEEENIGDEQLEDFQNQLWLLWGHRTELYTMGESSSVPTEVAEELLQSICYCISCRRKPVAQSTALAPAKALNINELFPLGLEEVERQISIGKKLLKKTTAGMLKIPNDFYLDATSQAALFFKKYDYLFFAHQIPSMPDYPLCHTIEGKKGAEYIDLYLSRLRVENDFCGRFKTDTIILLLKACCEDYETQYMNIYEPVANNALALTLLHKNIFTLNVTEADCSIILRQLLSIPKERALAALLDAAEEICRQLELSEALSVQYLRRTAATLLSRIEATREADCFSGVFYSIYNGEEAPSEKTEYMDSEPMDNEALRDLIDCLNDCQNISDKIALAKETVHSLNDLAEVLNACFWGDESAQLFRTFDETAIALLRHFVSQERERSPGWRSESDWELALSSYFDHLDEEEKRRIQEIMLDCAEIG